MSNGRSEDASDSGLKPPPTVLLVDDEPRVLQGLVRNLIEHSYHLLTATSATEALSHFQGHAIDVIVSDEHMPGTRGLDLLLTVRDRYPNTVRIMLTGQASLPLTLRAINENAVTRFLQKPIRAASLAEAITASLAERQRAPSPHDPRARDPHIERALQVLSAREREVLELLFAGRRISNISRELFISPHTARNHIKAILRKLDVHSQDELIERYSPRAQRAV